MSAKTKIEWTDRTWNPVRGCSLVSAGCTNCYAMKQAHRFSGPGQPYEGLTKLGPNGPIWTGKVTLVEDALTEPLHWRKPCRVFVNSMSDLFHEGVPDSFIDRVFAVMALCPQHTFQILTKRPEQAREYFKRRGHDLPVDICRAAKLEPGVQDGYVMMDGLGLLEWPLPNVHGYVSVEDPETAGRRVPILLDTPWAVRGVSYEPALGAVDWTRMVIGGPKNWEQLDALRGESVWHASGCPANEYPALDHIIMGGESGPGARPMHPDWARATRDACVAAGVPFFFKQFGDFQPVGPLYSDNDTDWHLAALDALSGADKRIRLIGPSGYDWSREYERVQPNENAWVMRRVGKARAGRVLDGRVWDEMPGETAGSREGAKGAK